MKILLINPPHKNTITTNVPKIIEEGVGFIPPLGLMYIAGYIKKTTNHKIEILDCNVEDIDYDQLKEEITTRKPDIIGITTMTFTLIDVIKTLQIAKQVNSSIKTVLGGPHPTIYPTETANIKEVDFCIIGEGEKPITALLENINDYEKLKTL